MNPRAHRCLRVGLALGFVVLAGCKSAPKHTFVAVTRAPPPPLNTAALLPAFPEDHEHAAWVLSDAPRLTDDNAVKFAVAREAYYNYEDATAERLLRELRAADGINDYLFHFLVLQCYEQSDRWAECLPLYAEFGIQEKAAGWLGTAQARARMPKPVLEFAAKSSPIPMELKFDELVIVDIEINGVRVRALVDTGASGMWLNAGLARRLGARFVNHTSSNSDAHGASRATELVLLDEVRLGTVTARNVAAAAGTSLLLQKGLGVEVIIGWDLLQYCDVTWDFPRREMTVAKPDGPISDNPILCGRIKPLITVLSPEGRPLQLFLDTGWSNGSGYIQIIDNDGVLATKTSLERLKWSLFPTFGAGLHSITIKWPRYREPYSFWMADHMFELPGATLKKGVRREEMWAYADGVAGNGPFLTGKLRLCGVRRLVEFEPAPPSPHVVAATGLGAISAAARRQ